MNRLKVIAAQAALCLTTAAWAQDAYIVGLSGAITGPNADTYAPGVESVRLYIDQLNKSGGVNGKQIRLIVADNQGEPSKAAADAKKFVTQDNAVLLVNVGLSSSYGPMVAEAKRARVPLLFAGAACPAEVLPPIPDELQFCSIAAAMKYDADMALRFIKEQSRDPVKLGLVAMAIPVSRAGIDYAESLAPKLGMTAVQKEQIPPTTPDYTPFGSKLKGADPNWVYSWAPWVTEVKTFEALRKVGWTGRYIAAALNPAEDELARVKDEGFHGLAANAMFLDNLPVHQQIRDAARGANLTYPITQMAEGWVAGMVIEQTLKNVAWPPTPEKVLAAMGALKVDTKGLRGGPIEWTKTNHFRSKQYYRIYRWDAKKQAVTRVQDWVALDVK
jgi:branched-chain amino acid transport system substrate-binding protein